MKYVLNKCFGGFGLSNEAFEWLKNNKGWIQGETYKDECDFYSTGYGGRNKYYMKGINDSELEFRCREDLVECVETLGDAANGSCASLSIVNCPMEPSSGIEIDEYDGIESIQTIPDRW